MYFDSLHSLIFMDGHGAYVWAVYGVALTIVASLALSPVLRRQRFVREELSRLRRERQAGAVGRQT